MEISVLIISLFLTLFLHFILRHYTQASMVYSFIMISGGMSITIGIILFYAGLSLAKIFSLILIYVFFAELYLFLITFSLSSISANILVMLSSTSKSISEIEQAYSGEYMAQKRVARLIQVKFVEERNEKIYLTDKGMYLVRIMSILRSIFAHEK